MRDLPPDAESLLARARRAQASPDPATRARVRQRVAAMVAAGIVASTATRVGASAGAKTFASLPLLAKVAGVSTAVIVAVGAIAGPTWLATPKAAMVPKSVALPKVEARAGARERSDDDESKRPPVAAAEDATAPIEKVVPSEARVALAEAAPARHEPRSAHAGRSLRAELDLLDRANQALARADLPAARALIERHRADFASPMLREEREGLELIVRCTLDGVGARADVEAFLARAKRSVLRVRVESACGRAHD